VASTGANTPLTSVSAPESENGDAGVDSAAAAMAKLASATDRCVHIDVFSSSDEI
jgi:hypothetical protein